MTTMTHRTCGQTSTSQVRFRRTKTASVMHMADVLVVIVSTNDGRWLHECFDALANSRGATFDTLLVVNDCTDESVAAASRAPMRIEVVATSSRCGFAETNNLGIRRALAAGYSYVFLLNPDTKIHPDALAHLKQFLDANQDYGIAGSQQICYDGDDWDLPNRWTTETLDEARRQSYVPVRNSHWTVLDHYYVQGAALMMRTNLVTKIGLLDPLYGTFYEETDLCRRARYGGYGVAIVLDSRVKHYEGGHWRRTRRDHLHRDMLFLRNQYVYFMSDAETAPAALYCGFKVFLRQMRAMLFGEHQLRLALWRYPGVLVRACMTLRYIPRLRRRNSAIRARETLEVSEYAIGARRC
jgi:GT2 family glycosyltransferase